MVRVKVLFICLGNICRSPMAEAIFAHKVKSVGLRGWIEADSAGTGGWHVGESPHMGTRSVLRQNKIDYSHRARQLTKEDLDNFDYIVTMDNENYHDVLRLGPSTAKVVRFMDYAPELKVPEVPDPWYDGRFDYVYTLINAAAEGLLDAIRKEKGL